MLESPPNTYFSQGELEKLIGVNTKFLLELVQELMNYQLLKLVTQNATLKFSAVQKSEAEKVSRMTEEEKMIYSHIEAAGRDGIWQKIIKSKTNLHQHIFTKSLKNLEQKRYVKSIKDVKHPTRKIYMLYNLQPSIELTGGPWFTDSELDTEFVESLLGIVWKYVVTKSYPSPFATSTASSTGDNVHNPNAVNKVQCSYAAQYENYPSLYDIQQFIQKTGITSVELSIGDIKSLCDVLIFEDKIEKVPLLEGYKATWQSVLEAGGGIQEGENPMAIKETPFSVFDFFTQIPPGDNDPDVMFLDSWINA